MLRFASLALAAAAVLVIVLVGAGRIMRPPDVGPPPGPITSSAPAASATEGEVVQGWPTTRQNPAGVYSWDGSTCAGTNCIVGFMHNGYGSGSVDVTIERAGEGATADEGAEAMTVAGHDGIYQRIDARTEEWIVNIEGTTIAIRLKAEGSTTPTELAEAHAIIGSMRTEKRDTNLGFRLIFTLTTDDWDSG